MMDKVRFACPRCGTMMQTSAEKVGYDVACPNCAHRFKLVEQSESSSGSGNSIPAGNLHSIDEKTLPPSSGIPGQSNPPSRSSIPGSSAAMGGASAPYVSHAMAQPVANPVTPGAYSCPYCQTKSPPIWKSEVSTIGWIVFAVLLLTTCFGCVVGLFIRDKYRVCSQCKIRLG